MRILYHHRTLAKDGQDVHIREMIDALRRGGNEVFVVGPAEATVSGVAPTSVLARLRRSLPAWLTELLELGYSLIAYRQLREAYLRLQPDFVYERYNLFLLAGSELKRRLGAKLVLEVNSPLAHERACYGRLVWKQLANRLERRVWRDADYVLPVTDVLADFVRAAGTPEERIRVIHNGVNRAHFTLRPGQRETMRASLGLGSSVVLGFVGYLRPWHGLTQAVDLVADLRDRVDVRLLIIGDGPARADIEARAQRRGVERLVTFTGPVSRAEVPNHVAAFDVALQPSVTPYASPLKLFEYMALGRAIVAPDQANIREILTDGVNALLFQPENSASFAAAVERLCLDGELRERLGAAASATIERRGFLWDVNAHRVVQLIQGQSSAQAAAA